MLKTIIKRSGEREAFEPMKLNKWSEWSSEDVRGRVDWASIVMNTVKSCGTEIESQALNQELIKQCVRKKSWPHSLMAGRLYNSVIRKDMYGDIMPTVAALQAEMRERGYMVDLGYSDEEYAAIEEMIDHSLDMHMAYFQIKQIKKKYSLANRIKGKEKEFETPQYVFMRMAMALSQDEPAETKLHEVREYYRAFAGCIVNAPSPNYMNLGTKHNGYASCCLYTTGDNARSLAIGDHIAYTMTYMSSGIGGYLNTRSLGDPVRGGIIEHKGKFHYYEAQAGAVKANTQGGRGGACTTWFSIFDPEVETLLMLQNPRTPVDAQIRDIHFGGMFTKLFMKKVLKNEQIFLFNTFTAPDLHDALFDGDDKAFEALYNKYEQDENFVKKYVSARAIALRMWEQRHEVATLYTAQIDEINRHTPFKKGQRIHSSNLCAETLLPTEAYEHMLDLYKEEEVTGEVATCSLAGVVMSKEMTDEQYFDACYRALKMADKCIHLSYYELPNVGFTAKQRLSVGVGIIGLAHHMAKLGLKYDTVEGRNEIHRVSERHMYFLIKASLQLGKELGNAPWMHKTKWPEGWLPIDTYKKAVDETVTIGLQYDWETLRAEIIANGGIRHSTVAAHMPTESSSKASGAPNGPYPIRDLSLKKSDAQNVLEWCAPDNDILEDQYQLAWDISSVDMMKVYGIIQKFTDQGISADFYTDRVAKPIITSDDMLEEMKAMVKYGVKTQYYQNTYSGDSAAIENTAPVVTADMLQPHIEGTLNTAHGNVAKQEVNHETSKAIASMLIGSQASAQDMETMLTEAMGDGSENSRGCASGVCTL